ncbi:MAG: hypothetical protein IPJ01_01760 [Micavibrio sp.]|nr:hypothetical protein [Micavibrio sp.]
MNNPGTQLAEIKILKRRYGCFIFLFWSCVLLSNVFIVWQGHWRFYDQSEIILLFSVTFVSISGWFIAISSLKKLSFQDLKIFENGLYINGLGMVPWKNVVEAKINRQWLGFLIDFGDEAFLAGLENPPILKTKQKSIYGMNFCYPLLSSNISAWKFYNLLPQKVRDKKAPNGY